RYSGECCTRPPGVTSVQHLLEMFGSRLHMWSGTPTRAAVTAIAVQQAATDRRPRRAGGGDGPATAASRRRRRTGDRGEPAAATDRRPRRAGGGDGPATAATTESAAATNPLPRSLRSH